MCRITESFKELFGEYVKRISLDPPLDEDDGRFISSPGLGTPVQEGQNEAEREVHNHEYDLDSPLEEGGHCLIITSGDKHPML